MPTHINCNDIVDFTFQIGKLFFLVALLAAAAMAVAEAIARFKTPAVPGPRGAATKGIGDLLGALKDLLLALGNLPVWFAIFLAGGALIWFARETISLCH